MLNEQFFEEVLTLHVPDEKSAVFRFNGGPRDGQELRSDGVPSAFHRINEADLYWLATAHGEIGKQFACLLPREMEITTADGRENFGQPSNRPFRKYRYTVVDTRESQADVIVTCRFIGEG
jgi:hypothetical protein